MPKATTLSLAAILAGLASAAGTALVRRLALRHAVLDVPNERSLHAAPTPRGGGIAIAAVSLVAIAVIGLTGTVAPRTTIGLVGGGLVVALVGWLDDLRGVRPRTRLVCHIAAAIWLTAWLSGVTQLRFGSSTLALGPAGWVVAVLGITWMINLYNFMDGIDGLAGGEAVIVACLGGLGLLAADQPGLAAATLIVAAASAGFLVFNWPPARIFMGDVGSGLLGFLLAGLGLASERAGGPAALTWVLWLGVFVVDATITLARRFARGERWFAAHKSHAYQRAVQGGWTHGQVSAAALTLTAMLGGLGWVAELRPRLALAAGGFGLLVLLLVYLSVERHRPMYTTPPAS